MQTAGYSDGMRPLSSNSTLRSITEIARHEGWIALFKGLSINYYKVVPAVSISFTTYEYLVQLLKTNWK
jgi:hypothetical protein